MVDASAWLTPAARTAYVVGCAAMVHAGERMWPRVASVPEGRRRVVNLAHWALVVAVNLALVPLAFALLAWAEARHVGLARWLSLGPGSVAFVAVIGLDFVAWSLHVGLHKAPVLWRLHRVHHNDRLVDVTTALRQHPIETTLRVAASVIGAALLGLPEWALGLHVAVSGGHAAFEHGNLRLPAGLDRWIRRVLVTPDMHRVHHSRRVDETDSNYANVFAFWDRLGGTYRASPDPARIPIGLDGLDDAVSQTLPGLMALPFRATRTR